MKAKNKSFIEDVVILFILGIIIYFIYSFFFSTEEKVEIVENKTTIEKEINIPTPKEAIINEIKKEEEIVPTTPVPTPVETPKVEAQGEDLFTIEAPKTEVEDTLDFTVVAETPAVVETPVVAIETPMVVETPKIEVQEVKSSFSRNDILEEAIAKMQTRKEIISTTKSSKQTTVDELNEQIKKLKKEVSTFEWEIKDLEKEDSAIDLDIASFEKMKSAMVDVSDRTRVHNLDNIKKK